MLQLVANQKVNTEALITFMKNLWMLDMPINCHSSLTVDKKLYQRILGILFYGISYKQLQFTICGVFSIQSFFTCYRMWT